MESLVPGVFFRRDPTAPEVPLVFDSPHSGADYPADFRYSCPLEILRMAEDSWVDELYAAAPEHGATLIGALFPRSYLDANRHQADIDEALLDAPWPSEVRPSEKTRLGQGLVRRLAKPGLPVYDHKLTVAEMQSRIRTYYEPYHATLQQALDRLYGKFGVVWHINCHSMPERGNEMSSDPGAVRADFVLGDRDGTTCDAALTDFVRRVLAGRGFEVKVNEPYKGVELVRRHGRPAENRHSLQIEVNRRLYMDEKRIAKNDNFPKLAADITHLIGALASFARGGRIEE
jgi:N-formylglutamate deformylase